MSFAFRGRLVSRAEALGLFVLAGCQSPPAPTPGPRVVEAERFVLKDARGRTRAVLGCEESEPYLKLLSETGVPLVTLHVDVFAPAPCAQGGLSIRGGDSRFSVIFDRFGAPMIRAYHDGEQTMALEACTFGPGALFSGSAGFFELTHDLGLKHAKRPEKKKR